jgi:hypothetical protein
MERLKNLNHGIAALMVVYDLCVRGILGIWTQEGKWIVGQMVSLFFPLGIVFCRESCLDTLRECSSKENGVRYQIILPKTKR